MTHRIAIALLLSFAAALPAALPAAAAPPVPVEVSAGLLFSCARADDGTVTCWGAGSRGQLGNGDRDDADAPVAVTGIAAARALDAGWYHACAVVAKGRVRCWGEGRSGQLGDGRTRASDVPVTVARLKGMTTVSAGWLHTCAVRGADGAVYCWGAGDRGQIGDGTQAQRTRPARVRGLPRAAAVSAGGAHTCALARRDGSVWCWGENGRGQIGDGTRRLRVRPRRVDLPDRAVSLSTGYTHTCAALESGRVFCWGDDAHGQLGDGTTDRSSDPVRVEGLTGADRVAAGFGSTCARIAVDGSLVCWGDGIHGQLGSGLAEGSLLAVPVTGIAGAGMLDVGGFHACALVAGPALACWGAGSRGQLGDGLRAASPSPVTVAA